MSIQSHEDGLSSLRLSDGQLLIVAKAGFNLEAMRVASYLRIKKLFVLPVIALCWSHKVGEWKDNCICNYSVCKAQRVQGVNLTGRVNTSM